jgi:hypothetical protein
MKSSLTLLALLVGLAGLSEGALAENAPNPDGGPSDVGSENPEAAPKPQTEEQGPTPEEGADPAPEASEGHDTEVEELVDFEVEERESEAQAQKMVAAAGGGNIGGMGGNTGIKLFVDLLLNYQAGQKSFDFKPNHTYVLVQADITESIQFLIHVSDDPILFELTMNLTENLSFVFGKMLLPFGINQFHHIIGGRVDHQSHFLPETWGDYGGALKHRVYDGEYFSTDYSFYLVNGFSGTDGPVFSDGTASDNNFAKALGGQLTFTALHSIVLTGSAYYDIWDEDNERQMLFYALGLELRPGLYRAVPILNRMRFRGEWARGEIEMPERNYQQGLIKHAFARAGYFGEMTVRIIDPVVGRLRVGRINPDNTISDSDDVEVYEPAILIGTGKKVWWTVGYQFTMAGGFQYGFDDPPDVAYAKVFVMY